MRTPQAMEQVFQAMSTLRNSPGNPKEYYIEGEVTRWFSLEIVSFGGEVHFYIRTYAKQRNLVEAAIFAYYPDVEIEEVPDYAVSFPKNVQELYERGWDAWGTEMVLVNDAAYPIKSYSAFSQGEESSFDPMSVFLEILGKIKLEEIVAIQFNITPKDPKWAEKYKGVLKELKGGEKKEGEGEKDGKTFVVRTPGETERIKAVENNLSKPAFETVIRYIYLSPKTIFYETFARRGIAGAFNQYSSLDLNGFKPNYDTATRVQIWNFPHLFSKTRVEYRKNRLLYNYRTRAVPLETVMGKVVTSYLFNWNSHSKSFELNTESLATLFHPPTQVVLTAPFLKRVESRKVGPPAGLAIFGNAADLERFSTTPQKSAPDAPETKQ